MKKIMCIMPVLMVSIYSLALADAGIEISKVSFEFEVKNENDKNPYKGK